MSFRPRKSSACITLVLIGAAALSGCSDPQSARRSAYATREECLADWGDPKECEQQETRSSSGARSHYWGPAFGSHGSSSASRSGSSSGGHSISRGGFGSHGSSAS